MFNFWIISLAIAVRLQTILSGNSSAHNLLQPLILVSLTDSYKIVDIVIHFPRQLDLELQNVFQFTTVLQEVEKKNFGSAQNFVTTKNSAYHFDDLISSIKTEYGRAERKRNQIIDELKAFTNQTDLIQRQRRSPLLFAMGTATSITLEPLLEKADCRLLSVFGLCHSAKQKIEKLEGRLQNLESGTVHLNDEENETVHVLTSSSPKLHQDTKRVLYYTEDKFWRLQSNLDNLQQTMESLQQAQVCDHRRRDVFMFSFRAQSAINNVTRTLNAIQSELQIQMLYMKEEKTQFGTSMGVLANDNLPAALIPYWELQKILSQLKLGGKQLSISSEDSSLYYSLPLVRNVYVNDNKLLITLMIPVYSGEPIHDAYKAIAVPQPIKNSSTAATLKLDRNYLIVSRREERYAEMNSKEYRSCSDTPQLTICTKPVALVSAQDQLCLRALLYDHEVAALKTCVRDVTELPIFPTAVYLGNFIYRLYATDDQQFLYNITYQDGKKLSSMVNGCKSCLVHPPCNGKLLHPTNGLVMLPDLAECVE